MEGHDLSLIEGLTEGQMLQLLEERFLQRKFYVLLAFQSSSKDGRAELQEYRGGQRGTALSDPAHLFAFLSKIYRQVTCNEDACTTHTIILRGEVGTGKSFTSRQSVLFLASMQPEMASKWECAHALLEGESDRTAGAKHNPFRNHLRPYCFSGLLHAPCKCEPSTQKLPKTHSSKMEYCQVFFDAEGLPSGGHISSFGLELPRVSLLSRKKRNFNVFYYLVEGLEPSERDELHLQSGVQFEYLNHLEALDADDYNEKLQNFKTAFRYVVPKKEERDRIFKLLSCVLHLGNVKLVAKSARLVSVSNKSTLKLCAQLLKVDSKLLEEAILEHDPCLEACTRTVDELAMILYGSIVQWLIDRMNQFLKSSTYRANQAHIAILDLTGHNARRDKQNASDLFTNTLNESLTRIFCENIQSSLGLDLKYSPICTTFLESIQTTLLEHSKSGKDQADLTSSLQKLSNGNPFGEIKKATEGPLLEVNHFFRNVGYPIGMLHRYCSYSDERTLKQLSQLVEAATTGLFQSNECNQTSALFVSNALDHLQRTVHSSTPHWVACLRPTTGSDTTQFDASVVKSQLQVLGITKIMRGWGHKSPRSDESTSASGLIVEMPISPRSALSSVTPLPLQGNVKATRKNSSSKRKRVKELVSRGTSSDPQTDLMGNVIQSSGDKKKRSLSRKLSQRFNKSSPRGISENQSASVPSFLSIPRSTSTNELTRTTSFKAPKSTISSRLRADSERVIIPDDSFKELEDMSKSPLSFSAPIENFEILDAITPSSSMDSLQLSDDNLSSITEISSEEEDEEEDKEKPLLKRDSWQRSMANLTRSQEQANTLRRSISGVDRTSVIQTGPANESRKLKEEFLFLYSCGSLLRTIYQKDDPSGTLAMLSSRVTAVEFPAKKKDWRASRSSLSATDAETRHAIGSFIPDTRTPESNWIEELEKTPQQKDWERKSLNMRQKKNILPLLRLQGGDAVLNQINYSNPIRITPRRQKASATFMEMSASGLDVDAYAASRFAISEKITKKGSGSVRAKQLKKLLSASKTPLSSPLHQLRPPNDVIAVENSKHIYLYMLSKPGENASPSALDHIRCIVENGLRHSTLRDEIYCQLVKQVTNPTKERFGILGWELIAICTGCFAPAAFFKPLTRYLDVEREQPGEIGAWAAYCKDRLLKTADRGKRLFVPVEREVRAIQLRKPLMEVFHFMDGKQKQIPIYSSTTAEEALEFLLQMVGLAGAKGYMIYESYLLQNETESETIERSLLNSEVICTSLSRFHLFQSSFQHRDDYKPSTRFVVKRKLFLPDVPSSPSEDHLMFHQLVQRLQQGLLFTDAETALVLGGLQLQTLRGDYKPDSSMISPKEVVPEDLYDIHSVREWRKLLSERHQALKGTPANDARSSFLSLCRSLPLYGFQMFPVTKTEPGPGFRVQATSAQAWNLPKSFYIGLCWDAFYFMNTEKVVYERFVYEDIHFHSSTASTIDLSFEGDRSILLHTSQGEEILSIVIDYKYHHFMSHDKRTE